MRLSAKVSGAPPENHPRAKPAAAKAKPKSSPPAYESYEEEGEEYDESYYAPAPVARGKPKAKATAKAPSNGFQFGDEDETPRPPPMPPPKKKAAPKGSGGPPSTPITPAPKAAIRPKTAEPAWEDDGMGEEQQEDAAMDENGENWEEEAPPAKKIKIVAPQADAWGDSWGGPPKGKGKGWNQNQGWGDDWAGDGWGAGGAQKGKGKSKQDGQFAQQFMDQCDGIQDGLLPIQQRMEEVVAAVCGPCPVCCIGGETGSGKSTQVPQIIFKDACDKMQEVKIAVVQPRRVAAVSLARRVAHELGEHGPGGLVGHRIGGDSTPGFAIDFCSTGYFLQLLVNAPAELGRYSHVVLDEVHERSAESDLLCFVVRRLVSGPHKGVRIVIMSATVNMALFSSYFSRLVDTGEKPAEVFVGKKCFPVAEYFLEELVDAFPNFRCGHEISQRIHELFPEAIKKANSWSKKSRIDARHVEKFNNIVVDILRCLARGGSTIVVFLPGIAEITTVWQEARLLQDGGAFQVLPLHSMIPQEEQQAVFAPPDPKKTRVILATDIAESSITLPDITAIIDFGMHRRMDHGSSRSLASLTTKWVSRDAAKQRAGRAGRTQPGICIRLYTQHWFEQVMELHEPPETQSMPLDRLYLQAKQLCEKLGQTSKIQRSAKAALLELVQSPDVEKISASRTELADLGAIDCPEEAAKITRFGQLCTQLPLDLRLSRIIWLGVIYGCAADGVVLASVLSTNDPFQFPAVHFARSEDDFAGWLRETTGSRLLFDGGLQSEPMMLRQLFLEWLTTLHERHQPYGTWAKVNGARKKHTEQFAKMHRLAKGRMEHIVSQVVDLSLRTFHACAAGTRACKQLRDLIRLLGYSINERGDLNAVTQAEIGTAKELLFGEDPIFEDNTNILRGLLASTFSDFLMLGTYSGSETHESWGGKWNHTHQSSKSSKELQVELLQAVSEKEVDVHHTAWFATQKDEPVVGIEKYVDHVAGHSVAKPQVVLAGPF
jgi:HrpA-like RNA helicase